MGERCARGPKVSAALLFRMHVYKWAAHNVMDRCKSHA